MRGALEVLFVATLVLAAGQGSARADTMPNPSSSDNSSESLKHRLAPTIAVSLGATSFINQELRAAFAAGLAWSVKLGIGRKESVRLEGSYVGSSQAVELPDLTDRNLLGHGLHAALRVNLGPKLAIEPIMVFGVGWTRFAIDGPVAAPDVTRVDHVLEMPIAFGAVHRAGGFVFDARATFTIVSGADLLRQMDPTTSQDAETMHRVALSLGVGYEL